MKRQSRRERVIQYSNLTFIIVEEPEGVGVLVAIELAHNHVRVLLYQPVVSTNTIFMYLDIY